jgi:hypothetical protein
MLVGWTRRESKLTDTYGAMLYIQIFNIMGNIGLYGENILLQFGLVLEFNQEQQPPNPSPNPSPHPPSVPNPK